GGLEGVLRVVGVAQHPPAHPQHHRAVAQQERLERGILAAGDEPLQELRVADRPSSASGPRAVAGGDVELTGRHGYPSLAEDLVSSPTIAGRPAVYCAFLPSLGEFFVQPGGTAVAGRGRWLIDPTARSDPTPPSQSGAC